MFNLITMVYLHILDDFVLQGILLSKLKQKKWWEIHPDYTNKYKHDYKIGLLMHSISWAYMIMLPIA